MSRIGLTYAACVLLARAVELVGLVSKDGLVMINTIQREVIVEMLLNSLEAERYVRGPLLLNIVDELSGSDRFSPASEMAKSLLSMLEAGAVREEAFRTRIQELRTCVKRLSANGLSETPIEALARTTPRLVRSNVSAA
jgi:hypothetical protein